MQKLSDDDYKKLREIEETMKLMTSELINLLAKKTPLSTTSKRKLSRCISHTQEIQWTVEEVIKELPHV